jgi:hypothetical protein
MAQPSRRILAIVSIGVLSIAVLSACGGSDDAATGSASALAAASAMASSSTDSGSLVGNDPSTWGPVMVKKKKTVELIPRQVAVFPALEYANNENFTAISSDPAVVEILPADNSTVVGFRALSEGTAVVKVYNGPVSNGGTLVRKVTVTVNPA